MADESNSNNRYYIYVGLFLAWLIIYNFCEKIYFFKDHIEITKASLNAFMAFTVVIVTFYERYQIIFSTENYTSLMKSNRLFLAFALALVPFTAAVTDLQKTGSSSNLFTALLIFLQIISLIELIVVLRFSEKENVVKDTAAHIAIALFILFLTVITSNNVGPQIINLINRN